MYLIFFMLFDFLIFRWAFVWFACCKADDLLNIFQRLIHQQESDGSALIIESTPYSLSAMAEWLIDELSEGQSTLQNLLLKHDTKTNRIICFLATLELIRLQYVYVKQSDHLAPIHLSVSRLPNLPPIQSLIGEF